MKRFCLLQKFSNKYKIINKVNFYSNTDQYQYYNCIHTRKAEQFLVRIIDKSTITPNSIKALTKELSILRSLNHEQIQSIIEVFEDRTNVYVVFEDFFGRNLQNYLLESYQYSHQFDEIIIQRFILGLISAINHIHSKGIFHRNITLDNIMIPKRSQFPFCVLVNFINAEYYQQSADQVVEYVKFGKPGFMAPEIFKTNYYNNKIDIYSLGIILYIAIYDKSPFEGGSKAEIQIKNEEGQINFADPKLKNPSKSALHLLQRMLLRDPQKRWSASELLRHQWFIRLKKNSRNKKNQGINQQVRNKSLSTIIEASDINISHIMLQQKIQEINEFNIIAQEFDGDCLQQKLLKLLGQIKFKKPSILGRQLGNYNQIK